MAFDEALGIRIRDLLDEEELAKRDIDERRMFGGLAFLDRGLMFVGILGDELMARVGPTRHERALALEHVRPMDFTGKPMVGYVYVARPGIASKPNLRKWIAWSLEYVDTLPAKASKQPAKKQPAKRGKNR
jgi:TfoX/Sxy family transcriptional regulator of competence genes